jgi:hypothetical protein
VTKSDDSPPELGVLAKVVIANAIVIVTGVLWHGIAFGSG